VALVLEPRAVAAARGRRWYGACRVRTAFVPPHLAATPQGRDRLDRLVAAMLTGLGGGPLPVHAVVDGSRVGEAVVAALTGHLGAAARTGRMVSRTVAGLGCLTPMVRLSGLLTAREADCLVVTATAEGNFALARVFDPGRSPC
jgi:3-oxoacyl-[acyl-carrier-protein] synthase II